MAKKKPAKKVNTRNKPRAIGSKNRRPSEAKPKKGGGLVGFFRFLVSKPVRIMVLIVLFLALLFWQWDNIAGWVTDVATGTFSLFGWGLLLVTVVILALMAFIWRRPLSEFLHRYQLHLWNRWLAAIAFIIAIWGILGLLDLGGRVGLNIIGYEQNIIGILRVSALVAVGIILVAPRACWHAVKAIFRGLRWLLKPRPHPPLPVSETAQPTPTVLSQDRTTAADKIAPPPFLVPPEVPKKAPDMAGAEGIPDLTAKPETAEAAADLKQVAQEVWKKYGESPNLVTINGWRLPPIEILDITPESEFGQADNIQRARLIEDALASYGVEAKVVQINAGPTVTQFGVEPGWDRKYKEIRERDKDGNIVSRHEEVSKTRVKVEKITSLSNDLALALSAPSIRIEAPVPGKPVVGIEVPNTIFGLVGLRGVIETSAFQKLEARSKLALALGKGAGGESVAGDLAKMPHLLIAGATGSGKTVCLNTIICCLLLYNTPDELQFIMIDPKRVELTPFNSIPHLATPVIVDSKKALNTLRWLAQEMDKRYQLMAAATVRNIEGYNKKMEGQEHLPYLVLIIDELADLMMTGYDEVEQLLCRLAQLARATGIHLVVATQRPSVDVVTGLIKANFPTRISFAVTSQVDSRTILDMVGAEKLLGRGDMLYMPTEAAKPKRLQGCYVSDTETERLVYFWNSQKREEEAPRLSIDELISQSAAGRRGAYPEDPLIEAARQLSREHTHISTSFLQRKLHIGYPRAARLTEQLEEEMNIKGEE